MSVYIMVLSVACLLYFLIDDFTLGQSNIHIHSSFDKARINNNDFDGSVTVRNGQVFVNWSTTGPWKLSNQINTTVYFLTNSTEDGGNISYAVNISACFARKYKNTWEVNPLKGNLLKFCNESGACGPFSDDVTILIDSSWSSQQLSCQLFTSCSNFHGHYGIQIMVDADNGQYSYLAENMSISSQNIPPLPTNIQLLNNELGISWDYRDLSQLCGFGSNGSINIQFLLQYYKANDCVFMGEKKVDFHERSANISTGNYKYIFYLSALSLTSNQTSRPWLKQLVDKSRYTYHGSTCPVYGGMASFFWQPEWNCLGEDIKEQTLFCHGNTPCFPVCQAQLFKNKTIEVTSMSNNLINFCNFNSQYCHLDSNNTDMVDVRWDPLSGTIHCNIFKQCVTYKSRFFIKKTRSGAGINEEITLCFVSLIQENRPPAPTNLSVVSVYQNNLTISWDFYQCKLLLYSTNINICYKSPTLQDCEKVALTKFKELPMKYTVKNLSPFTKFKIEVYAENEPNSNGYKSASTYLTVWTKEGAPENGPKIRQIYKVKDGIKVTWENPDHLYGIPKQVVIEVLNGKNNTVYVERLNGTNITSTIIKDVNLKKCDFFQVKICNAPDLCSPFSNRRHFQDPCGVKNTVSPILKDFPKNKLFFGILGVAALIVLVIAMLLCYKRRRRWRTLPILHPVPIEGDTDRDYMAIGQMSFPNTEYDCVPLVPPH